MLVVTLRNHTAAQSDAAKAVLRAHGDLCRQVHWPHQELLLARVVNGDLAPARARIASLPGVERVVAIDTPYVLSARGAAPARTSVRVTEDLVIGGDEFVVIAGPCAVESEAQTLGVARAVRGAGARALRGGAFKPRSSPFSFQGLGAQGLDILGRVRAETGLPVVSELLSQRDLEAVDAAVDVIQIGMRNGLNYALLDEVGRLPSRRPVLLKCGIGSKLDELLGAADYLLAGGNPNVILCLRGTLGFSTETRCAMNVADIPVLRAKTHLPIVVDPSHVAGWWRYVPAIAASALVAGADGLLVEVHAAPAEALSDADQALEPELFHRLMHRLRLLAPVVGRAIAPCATPDTMPDGHPMTELCLEAPAAAAVSTAASTAGRAMQEAAP